MKRYYRLQAPSTIRMKLNRLTVCVVLIGVAEVHSMERTSPSSVFSLRQRLQRLVDGLDMVSTSEFSIVNEQYHQRKVIASNIHSNVLDHYIDRLRRLQTNIAIPSVNAASATVAAESQLCSPNGDGVVFPDDYFNILAFNSQYEPVCVCFEDTNTEEIFSDIGGANTTEFINNLNAAFSNLLGVIEYDCINSCANCFNDEEYCGLLQTTENSLLQGTEGNFTVEELRNGEITEASFEHLIRESFFSITTCINYTKGETGRLCYGGNFNLSAEPSCFVQYNDIMCNSCTFPNDPFANEEDSDCFVADCSNVGAANWINTCNDTGYDAAFRFLAFSESGVGNTSLTLGSCGAPTTSPIETLSTTLNPPQSATAAVVTSTAIYLVLGIALRLFL